MIRPLVLTVGFVASTLVLIWALGTPLNETPGDQVSRTSPDPLGLQPAMTAVAPPQAILMPEPKPAAVAPTPAIRPAARPVAAPQLAEPVLPPVRPVARPATIQPVPLPAPTRVPAPAQSNRIRALASEPETLRPAPTAPAARVVSAPEAPAPAPTAPEVAAPNPFSRLGIPSDPQDKVNSAVLTMGLGVVNELKKPKSQPGAQASTQSAAPLLRVPATLVPQVQPRPAPQILAARPATPAPTPTPRAPERTYTVQPGDSLPGIAFRYFGSTVAYLQILAANGDVLSDPAQLTAGMVLRIPDM